jgi:ethanolamine ammonia-lyase large subunit
MDGPDLQRAFTLANPFKEGDLAVGGTADDELRADARRAIRAATVREIRRTVFVDDGVSEALARSRNTSQDAELDGLTVGQLVDRLLSPGAGAWARRHRDALPSEAIAAIAKILSNDELSAVSRAVFNPLADEDTSIGGPGHFGSRLQPNSAGDDDEEILYSIYEGLSYGCGDVILGLNPASDDLDSIVRLERLLEEVVTRLDLPTRFCVLSDIVKQHAARARTRVDVGFQSLAGTSRALSGMVGVDVDGLAELTRPFDRLYFETGQGSEVTNGAAEGVDMVTLESRTYGLARYLGRAWTIVNDVAGFIGPEVFRTPDQLERACLEDLVMAKLHGLTMGLDVCATFHMGISPAALRGVTRRLVEHAAPAYLMAVAGNADPMLGYLTTSFREHPGLRAASGRNITSSMERRLRALGPQGDPQRFQALRARGLDLGGDSIIDADARVEAIYTNARAALYSSIDASVIRDACPHSIQVHTAAADREDYLAHPPSGEWLAHQDASRLAGLYPGGGPQVQFVISDGLNAGAVNEQLRRLLPPVRRQLAGCHVGPVDVVVRNGRVRAGYEIGGLVGASVVVHIIGERPGTGLNTLSAYLTYGFDAAGRPRWERGLDHAATTAICGIHPRGKSPETAAAEIATVVMRILERRRSGVALYAESG